MILQRDLYAHMRKDAFALFAAGTIDVFSAGFLKALWKLLYALGICDFRALNTLLLPMQSLGFLLAGVGVVLILTTRKKVALAAAPPLFSGTMVFISMMVLGLGAICAGLSVLAFRLKKKWVAIFFALTFFCCMGMGALSGKDATQALYNWIEQGINCAAQGCFLAGALVLHKSGLKDL